MGNLYTHIVRNPTIENQRINILSSLKKEYKSSPRNYLEINKLKNALSLIDKQIENRRRNKNNNKKQYQSIFNGAYMK